jgi:hypothetical protein
MLEVGAASIGFVGHGFGIHFCTADAECQLFYLVVELILLVLVLFDSLVEFRYDLRALLKLSFLFLKHCLELFLNK